MTRYIQNLWIVIESGTVLFHHGHDNKTDLNLFGTMMIALDSYAKGILEGGLSRFQFVNKQFIFFKKNDIIFIGCSSSKTKKKKIKLELKMVSENFFENYPVEIFKEWKGRIDIFFDFEEIIQEIFK